MPLLESQYITISDLQRVRMMMTIFRDLLSVPDDEKVIVGRMLGKWSDELYAALPELTEDLEDEANEKTVPTEGGENQHG